MAKLESTVLDHLQWLGFVQPTGLVVSAPALVRAGAVLERSDIRGQQALNAIAEERVFDPHEGPTHWLPDFRSFAAQVLEWSFSPKFFVGTPESPIPAELELVLPEYGETLRPDFAVREPKPAPGASNWQLLVRVLEPGQDLDQISRGKGHLEASPHGRMERLLRQTGVLAGLLFNGRVLRLISAPRGESSGWLDFQISDMLQTAGRPIATAMRLLLRQSRLITMPAAERLPALLESSRKFQNEVSEHLAEQVLHGLYELLRGFQAAHDASRGELLRQALSEHPDEVYRALLTVILRLVFLLYAEERDMLPQDETFLRYYSLAGLYERLREDAALYPDTMSQRYGAWAQLLVLFRMVHDGARCGSMQLPARHGVLFNPDRFPFLEGRAEGVRQVIESIAPPLVPDGTIYRILEKLLVLDGERISYRALDVEQIGSVYETMMGFRIETATGRSVAIKAQKKQGAPTTIDLEQLLEIPGNSRAKWVKERAERVPGRGGANQALTNAKTIEDLHDALSSITDTEATPDLVPLGAMVLQPSQERRRSGSHYTPRALTEPIVRTTFEPILQRLRSDDGLPPRPEQILDLKVCDPAMGSGAFLVEACRQLGDALIKAWHAHGEIPEIPSDEDEVVFARRLVAQRCIYGVDRNPVAVDLAKVSLWLVTLAREHALTFVDHALRHGDSLVGLNRQQIEALHWEENRVPILKGMEVGKALEEATDLRKRIRESDDSVSDAELRDLWDQAQFALRKVRLIGDLVVSAYFSEELLISREEKLGEFTRKISLNEAEQYRSWIEEWRNNQQSLIPFHWEIEFPEVFERKNPGFDSFIGNPPFLGGRRTTTVLGEKYRDWLALQTETSSNADICSYFFRLAFNLMRQQGVLGLIATNTIAQGDTRNSGLRWICNHGGEIFCARRRLKWPGQAAVVVSVVHIIKGKFYTNKLLDGKETGIITAFLFNSGGNDDPVKLLANSGKSFQGSILLGMGFTFDDTDRKGIANSLSEMRQIIKIAPVNEDIIFPYIGGEEVNNSPTQSHHRFTINFGEREEDECRKNWPDLMNILEKKVKGERAKQKRAPLRNKWWRHAETRPALFKAIKSLERTLVINCGATPHMAFAFLTSRMVYSNTLAIFPLQSYSAFCALQSRSHEIWTRFFGSSMKDDLRYTPSDCFETFPFPADWESHPSLEVVGKTYYEFRANLMIRNNQGLTDTYNRFHNRDENDADIIRLRELHAEMDRAVLDAYGWTDIPTACEFILDYEDEDEESSRKKKPWRYRWPDEVRDEVLARLLELNAQRAQDEARSGAVAGKTRGRKSKKVDPSSQMETLFS